MTYRKRYDYNADIWSLGIVLYELIAKNKPWFDPKMSTSEFFQYVVEHKYPPLPENTDPKLKYLVKIKNKTINNEKLTTKEIIDLYTKTFGFGRKQDPLVDKIIKNNSF